jgi:hypothetical protein
MTSLYNKETTRQEISRINNELNKLSLKRNGETSDTIKEAIKDTMIKMIVKRNKLQRQLGI